jgi:hypothetical protein
MAPEQVLGTRMKEPGVSLVQSRKRRSAMALSFAAVGALSFWRPDIAIQAHAGPNLDSRHAWAITLFAPAVFLLAYVVARNFALKTKFNRLGPTMLLGVWVSGGLFMTTLPLSRATTSSAELDCGDSLSFPCPLFLSSLSYWRPTKAVYSLCWQSHWAAC